MGELREWLAGIRNSDAYWVERTKSLFAGMVESRMENLDINRSQLAERLDSSAAYITKVLGGDSNLTIATMVKLARSLDSDLTIELKSKTESVDWRKLECQPKPKARTLEFHQPIHWADTAGWRQKNAAA